MTEYHSLTAEFCSGLRSLAASVPDDVLAAGQQGFVNVLGTAIAASGHPGTSAILGVAAAHGGEPRIPVPGRSERSDVVTAPLAIGFAAHLDDFDDTHLATVIHPGAATMAAAWSMGIARGAGGAEVLTAFALGCEAQLRIGVAMSPEHYDDGWHITGTCGGIGAAVAAGLLAGLDDEQMTAAVGIAASSTLGLREAFGTMTKPYHPGKAATNGVLAVLLAERDLTAPRDVLRASRGFFTVLSPRAHSPGSILDGLGSRWELLDNTFKPYPCGIVCHPSIDAAVALSGRLGGVGNAERIVARVHQLVPELTGNMDPEDGLQARFSTAHGIAVGLADGHVGLPQYADDRVTDHDVTALRSKVTFEVDEDCPRDQATVTIHLADGSTLIEHVAHARGSLARPLSEAELGAKVRGLVEPVLPGRSEGLFSAVADLPQRADLGQLIAACTPDSAEVPA